MEPKMSKQIDVCHTAFFFLSTFNFKPITRQQLTPHASSKWNYNALMQTAHSAFLYLGMWQYYIQWWEKAGGKAVQSEWKARPGVWLNSQICLGRVLHILRKGASVLPLLPLLAQDPHDHPQGKEKKVILSQSSDHLWKQPRKSAKVCRSCKC